MFGGLKDDYFLEIYYLLHLYLLMKVIVAVLLVIYTVSFQLPWTKPNDLNRGLPASIEIYTLNTTNSPFGTKLTGAYAKFNMNDTNLEMVVEDTNGDALGYFPKTPMEYASAGKDQGMQMNMWCTRSSTEVSST
jgi:hypothetical protein